MRKLKRFLEEREGVRSLIRLQSLILFIFSLALIVFQVFTDHVYVELDFMLLLMSFLPKTIQKFAEDKKSSYESAMAEKELKENRR